MNWTARHGNCLKEIMLIENKLIPYNIPEDNSDIVTN